MVCDLRCTLLVLSVFQIIAIVEKQLFDLLCLQWTPITLDAVHFLLTVVLFVGICRYIYSILVIYSVWCVMWTAWNVFVICFYYQVGELNKGLPILNLRCQREMSWLPNGFPGCAWCDHRNSSYDHIDPSFSTDSSISDWGVSTPQIFVDVETNSREATVFLTEPLTTPSWSFSSNGESTIREIITDPIVTTEDFVPSVVSIGMTTSEIDENTEDGDKLSEVLGKLLVNDDEEESHSSASLVSYKLLQALHAGVQCLLAIICFILSCSQALASDEEDSSCLEFDFISGSLLPQNEKNPTHRYQLKALYV